MNAPSHISRLFSCIAACFFGIALSAAVPAMSETSPLFLKLDRWLFTVPANLRFCDFNESLGANSTYFESIIDCNGPKRRRLVVRLTRSGAFDDFFITNEPAPWKFNGVGKEPAAVDVWDRTRQNNQDAYFRDSTRATGVGGVLQVLFDPSRHVVALAQSGISDSDEFFLEAGVSNPPIPVSTRALGGLASNHGLSLGSTMSDVARVYGTPVVALTHGSLTEWGYDIHPPRAYTAEFRYFIFKGGRVVALQYGHGN